MPTPLTDTERTRILELHAEGLSRNDICRQVGRSAGTVTNTVHAAGLTFDRAPEVAAATDAKRVDNAARRADMIARLYDQAGHLLDRLAADRFVTVGYSRDGNAITTLLGRDEAPPADIRHLSATAVNLLQACARLEQTDAHATAGDAAKSIVDRFFDAIEETTPDPEE